MVKNSTMRTKDASDDDSVLNDVRSKKRPSKEKATKKTKHTAQTSDDNDDESSDETENE